MVVTTSLSTGGDVSITFRHDETRAGMLTEETDMESLDELFGVRCQMM